MKLLVLAPQPFFQNRGTPIALRALLTALSKQGHTIDLLTYSEGEDVPIPSVTIHRIPALPGVRHVRPGFSAKKLLCDILMLFKCLSMARRRRYDIVHALEESAFMALFLKAVCRVPYVYDMDSSLPMQLLERYSWLRAGRGMMEGCERLVIRHSSGVIAVCKALEEIVQERAPGKPTLRLEDTSLLTGNGAAGASAPWPLDGGRQRVIMYVGNLETYQGVELLIEAFRILSGEVAAAHLVVVGGAAPDITRHRTRCEQLGLSARVHFLGMRPISELAALLSRAAVLVSPRIQGNNTPMKIYSYLDSGRPLLATRLPTHTQVLDDSIACLVAPEPAAMAAGLVTLLTQPDLAAGLALRAKERARRDFTPEAFELKVEKFYTWLEGELRARRAATGGA